ncbi:histone acetyltransferase p300-like [Oppia nitens]|uniref:histone acetyltransferase p300-like n=1 Tax=Oppia nitens TaxID=1686743 RepID=UPI0023DACD70|nr:histone acetyltransferase p300-like [Oppia nitens]
MSGQQINDRQLNELMDKLSLMQQQNNVHGSAVNLNITSNNNSRSNDREENIKRCIQSLVHSSECTDGYCQQPACHKLKRVVVHSRSCDRKRIVDPITGRLGCTVCRQLIALCCYHAKCCQQIRCPVPYCYNIKRKLRDHRHRQYREQLTNRRKRLTEAILRVARFRSAQSPEEDNEMMDEINISSLVIKED